MTTTRSNEAALAASLAFSQALAERWWRAAPGRLSGVYRIGSLAHGGFTWRYSDIDLAVIAAAPLAPAELRAAAAELSGDLAAKLSIFWADPSFRAGRFPPLDRVDYLDHAVALVERERVRPERPSRPEIRAYLGGAPLERWQAQSRHYRALPALGPGDHKPYLRCLLYPARLLYSWASGAPASNDEAVEFLRSEPVAGLDLDLIVRALHCRNEGSDLDALFPERATLERQYEACAAIVARG
jgi:predicted nucleotidyltransferase